MIIQYDPKRTNATILRTLFGRSTNIPSWQEFDALNTNPWWECGESPTPAFATFRDMLFDNKPLPTYYLRSDVHRMCLSPFHLQAYASYTGSKPDNVKTRYFNLTGTRQQFTFEVGHDELWANHAWHRLAARVSGRRLFVLGLNVRELLLNCKLKPTPKPLATHAAQAVPTPTPSAAQTLLSASMAAKGAV